MPWTCSSIDRSIFEFGTRLRLVRAKQWMLATPCDDWDVRALVNHVVGGALRYTMLLHGATADDVVATVALDHLGEAPVGSFERQVQEVAHVFGEPGALSRNVHHPAGDISGQELLGLRITEFAVHAWDLSRAIGADEQIDPALVSEMWKRLPIADTRLEDGESQLARLRCSRRASRQQHRHPTAGGGENSPGYFARRRSDPEQHLHGWTA